MIGGQQRNQQKIILPLNFQGVAWSVLTRNLVDGCHPLRRWLSGFEMTFFLNQNSTGPCAFKPLPGGISLIFWHRPAGFWLIRVGGHLYRVAKTLYWMVISTQALPLFRAGLFLWSGRCGSLVDHPSVIRCQSYRVNPDFDF